MPNFGSKACENMAIIYFVMLSFLVILVSSASNSSHDEFSKCFSSHIEQFPGIIQSKSSPDYSPILESSIRNKRFSGNSTSRPTFIVVPFHKTHIQAAVRCAKASDMQIRTRSGGHDYEGLSYVSREEFILIDLANIRSIKVDPKTETAWVDSGATLGELYYEIAKKSNVHGFAAGSCPTVGVGGHFSGGGFGTLFRKYGLAADSVIDAKLIDVNGNVLLRKSMGEDLFWAIRGGGGASFGIIVSWKVKLVSVPQVVTVFSLPKTLEQDGDIVLHKWQTIAHKLPQELYLSCVIETMDSNSSSSHNRSIQITFHALYLGKAENFVHLMQDTLPELGLKYTNCKEMTWIKSVLYFAGFLEEQPIEVLLNRTQKFSGFFKAKADYVKEAIPESGFKGLYKRLFTAKTAYLILTPYGGKMSEISESEIPFPHRKGNLYQIQYMITWDLEEESRKSLEWMRNTYSCMKPYVSKSPREAYLNYRDLDLGCNKKNGNTSIGEASVWGLKYFKNNFYRLAQVKTRIDPSNFFRNEQSIPLLF